MPPFKRLLIGQPVGLAAKKAALEKENALTKPKDAGYKEATKIPPEKMSDRIGIVFDDSGSMSGKKIEEAKAGVTEFLRCCRPGATSVAVYPFNPEHKLNLCSDLLAISIMINKFRAECGTPLYTTSQSMLKNENLTRAIIFSDGSPTDHGYDKLISIAKEKELPIDTVYIGHSRSEGVELLRKIAEATGGVFLIFDPRKTSFRNSFKYLAPAYRAMLADKSFVEDLQNGKRG